MDPEYPLSEQAILRRYELEFEMDEYRADMRYSYRMAAALAGSSAVVLAMSQELTESDRVWARIVEAGAIYTGGVIALLGGAALVNAAQEFVSYRRSTRIAEQTNID